MVEGLMSSQKLLKVALKTFYNPKNDKHGPCRLRGRYKNQNQDLENKKMNQHLDRPCLLENHCDPHLRFAVYAYTKPWKHMIQIKQYTVFRLLWITTEKGKGKANSTQVTVIRKCLSQHFYNESTSSIICIDHLITMLH